MARAEELFSEQRSSLVPWFGAGAPAAAAAAAAALLLPGVAVAAHSAGSN